jgi:hypothetical protein
MSGRLTDCPPVPKPSGSPAACVHTAGDYRGGGGGDPALPRAHADGLFVPDVDVA